MSTSELSAAELIMNFVTALRDEANFYACLADSLALDKVASITKVRVIDGLRPRLRLCLGVKVVDHVYNLPVDLLRSVESDLRQLAEDYVVLWGHASYLGPTGELALASIVHGHRIALLGQPLAGRSPESIINQYG